MSQPPITEENQLSLLFKQFQGVAQAVPGYGTTPAIQYNAETIAKLNSIYSSSVFVEPVPKELEKNIGQMKNDSSFQDTQWTSGGTVWNQSIGKTNVNDTTGTPIPYLYFYKRVYLKSTGNDNSWWLPEQSTPSTWSSSTNRLRNMIPWLYNDTNASMFTPIIEYWDPTFGGNGGWRTVGLQNQNSGWVIDYASGLVVFYNERTTLNNTYGFDQSAADTDEKARPRISFVRYEGDFLEDVISTIGGGSGGASQVGLSDNSGQIVTGSTFDASAILFNENQFDVSNNSGKAIITISDTAFVSDISRFFFDIPPAPYSGDISKNTTATAAINMTWKLPDNYLTSLPFGKTSHYIDGLSGVSNENVRYLPFFKELRIDALDKSDPNKNPTNDSDWEPLDTSNNTTQPFFPPSLTSAIMHADGTSGGTHYTLGITNTYPFTQVETDQVLQSGKPYQFRIYLTNDASGSVTDPTYGHTTPWNYYYLPEGSGGQIELGSFGPPTAPTGAEIFNHPSIFNEVSVDISNENPLGADASTNNIGWPIPNSLDLQTRFGGNIDGVPDPSNIALQMPNIRSQIQDSSAEILGPYGKNGTLDITDIFSSPQIDLSSASANWQWYPETKYTLSNVYMQNNTVDFSNQIAPYTGPDSSCNTGVPSRGDLAPQVATNRLELNPNEPLLIDETTNTAVKTIAYPQFNASVHSVSSPDSPINDVYFITNNDVVDFEINTNPGNTQQFGPWCNNSDRNGGSVGTESVAINLTKYEMSIQDHTPAPVIPLETTPSMVGFLDVSGIDYIGTNFTLSAESFDAAVFPTKGYYTDIKINKSEIVDICLNNVPDICNNLYKPYEVAIQDICGNDKLNKLTGPFSIGRTPLQDINYNLPTSLSTPMTLNFAFFGQALPILTNSTLSTHTYDITNIDDYWRRSLVLATTRSIYNNSLLLENGTNTMAPIDVSWNNFTGNTKTVTPTVIIEPSRIWDISSESDSKRYSRNVLSTTTPQFAVYISGDNNVARTPQEISGNYPIQFGGTSKHLFWDYTWDQNPNGSLPLSIPSGFFSYTSGSPTPDFTTRFEFLEAQGNLTGSTVTSAGAALQHWPNKMPNNQLLWANDAFRGAGITAGNKNNPYVDFSGNYYNPSVTINGVTRLALEDYSTDKTSGVAINETFQQPFDGWWDDVNSPAASGPPLVVTDKAKYITFRTWMPPVDRLNGSPNTNTQGYRLTVNDSNGLPINRIQSSNSTNLSNGYWVYHVEIPPTSTPIFATFSGQKVSGPGNGCYSSSISGFKVSNTVPSLGSTTQTPFNLTQVEISIGLTINSILDIGSVEIEWVAN